MSIDSIYGRHVSSDTALTMREQANPILKLCRNTDLTLPYTHLNFTYKLNDFDKMTEQLPEWEIYTTPKERVKIILDTFDNKNFNVLLANYLWLYDRENCRDQIIALPDFHKLPDIEELYKWFKYWREKK